MISIQSVAANDNVLNQSVAFDGDISDDPSLSIDSSTNTIEIPQSEDSMTHTNDTYEETTSYYNDDCVTGIESNLSKVDEKVCSDNHPLSISSDNDYVTANDGDGSTPLSTEISVSVDDIYVGDDAIIKVIVMPSSISGNVIITVDDRKYTLSLKDGKGTLNIPDLLSGIKNVTATYQGNANYSGSENTTSFTVSKVHPNIIVDCDDIYVGDDEIITVNIPSDATGEVSVLVNGESYTSSVIGGIVFFDVSGLKAGRYPVQAIYFGDEKYTSIVGSNEFRVFKFVTDIKTTAPDIEVGNDGVVKVKLSKDATGNVTIEIDDEIYNEPVEDGVATFIIPDLEVGKYPIKVHYIGDENYYSRNDVCVLNVLEKEDNKTSNKTGNKIVGSNKINSVKYEAGNPVFALLLALVTIGALPIRKFKK
jgi:hypothetical protein